MGALRHRLESSDSPDLLDLMQETIAAMQATVSAKLRLFGSSQKAESM